MWEVKEVKKKVSFPENVKLQILLADILTPTCKMIQIIDVELLYTFTQNTWIGNSGALFHILNDNSMHNVTALTNWYKAAQAV